MSKPTKLPLAEHQVVTYFHAPKDGTSFEAVLVPEYWSHVAHQLRPGHRIEVFPEDGTWHADLLVRSVGRTEALVAVLNHVEFGEATEVAEDPDFIIRLRGPKKWSVVRLSDGAVIKEGIDTREQAEVAMRNHVKAMAA